MLRFTRDANGVLERREVVKSMGSSGTPGRPTIGVLAARFVVALVVMLGVVLTVLTLHTADSRDPVLQTSTASFVQADAAPTPQVPAAVEVAVDGLPTAIGNTAGALCLLVGWASVAILMLLLAHRMILHPGGITGLVTARFRAVPVVDMTGTGSRGPDLSVLSVIRI